MYKRKKPATLLQRVSLNWALTMSYFHMGDPTLSSALFRFTTEFAAWVTMDRNEVSQPEEVSAWMRDGTQLHGRIQNKKPATLLQRVSLIRSLAMTYFHMGDPTLSSALFRFTTEFGMESGGSKTLLSPSKFCINRFAIN